jgi:thiamine biosynthesis lipoprotein
MPGRIVARVWIGLLAQTAIAVPPSRPIIHDEGRIERERVLMGTTFRVIVYGDDPARSEAAIQAAFDRVAHLERVMSDYDPESELSRLCTRAGQGPTRISDDLFDVLTESQELAKATDGAFDITVGPIVRLWRRARRTHEIPEPAARERALALVGYQHLILNRHGKAADLRKPGMKLDLGGIGKGWAADEALDTLRTKGFSRALVAAAGDVVVGDAPPGQLGWTVAVASPAASDPAPSDILLLQNQAVSTSGDLEQFVEIAGTRYAHIVNPRTGLGVVDRASVSVVAQMGREADAMATAVYVMGPERGLPLAESRGDAALHVSVGPSGRERLESKSWLSLPRVSKDPTGAAR